MKKQQSIDKFSKLDEQQLENIAGGSLSFGEILRKINRNSKYQIITPTQIY
ncbi:ComC/BlpC family leader-containing pheromone/bacteriocin [Streptococcus halotolerans]|uniref:ComC/BlpC family leader-containing pheromone/bacteriocin n=1 Tax=Streptococcus halotolerans TaxID=1814128 RepID=UPI0009EF488D|nr:ComC/BlpC family leader-containing pheromone/bacteriocin [Streptococcus halotolerans]